MIFVLICEWGIMCGVFVLVVVVGLVGMGIGSVCVGFVVDCFGCC